MTPEGGTPGGGTPEGGASTGVLLMAYGTPASPDDVEAYYTHVRRGRPPTPELLADLRRRYEAIGGASPLLQRTRWQVAGVQAALGDGFLVELGMKHAPPFVEDGLARLAAAGVDRVVGVVLAPHYSALSVGEYAERVRAATPVVDGELPLVMVDSWHLQPGYVDLLAARLGEALAALPLDDPDRVEVVFTAHSLPARILETGDPYAAQLRATAEAVAERAGSDAARAGRSVPPWRVAWQSAGRTPEPWLGPDLLTVLGDLAADGVEGVVVCPAGFVSDHLEILYDLDVEARQVADRVGLAFARTLLPNDDPRFCATLADVVRDHLARVG